MRPPDIVGTWMTGSVATLPVSTLRNLNLVKRVLRTSNPIDQQKRKQALPKACAGQFLTRLVGSKRIKSETAPGNWDLCFRKTVRHFDRALTWLIHGLGGRREESLPILQCWSILPTRFPGTTTWNLAACYFVELAFDWNLLGPN